MSGITYYECNKVSEELALSLTLTFFFVEVHGVHFCNIMNWHALSLMIVVRMYLKLKEQGGCWSLSLRTFLTSLPRSTVKCQPVHHARIRAQFKY
jgi:hypothetical protein